ncbi:FG-GAP-like repeat-containing protein [Kitasatospora sp. NPDC085879]|uniref:FG-GAP-like repeat-containing protein n=1 Tax=Kitasatospora sp. NPDC085879 TaxID=3154769 RepID=UPI003430A278
MVETATTATDQLTANPDGSFTLDQSLAPVRKHQGGAWKPLDATLVKRSDGSVGPVLAGTDLTLSGGGDGPLTQMRSQGRSLSLDLPATLASSLPAPELSGPTATYHLLAGVDLKVTADVQGGFSEVLVVRDATAAANPALKSLSFTTRTTGVNLAVDAGGNLTAKDKSGKVAFSAPAPVRGVWDSAVDTSAPTVTDPTDGQLVDARSGEPAHSTAAAPGATAHTAPLKAAYGNNAITLTPDPDLLSGKNTVWPLYIDPTYSAGGSALGWTYVSSAFPTTSYWKTSDSEGLRVGYNNWDSPYYVGRTFARMSVPSQIYGAQISSSRFYATETWAPSCNKRDVELWWTGAISSSTTWNNQPAWMGKSDTQNAAWGYTGCNPKEIGFDTTSLMQNVANAKLADITLGLRASNESDGYGWKKFQPSTMKMSTTYNHAPNTPVLSTSPPTSCPASTPTPVGNGDIDLRAAVFDPEGGIPTAKFKVTKTSTGTVTWQGSVSAGSGTDAVFVLHKDDLVGQAGGVSNPTPTTFSWNVAVDDGSATTTSATCSFTFDPIAPGAPDVHLPETVDSFVVGTPYQVSITANTTGPVPATYLYQLNEGTPVSVAALNGSATVTVTPTRAYNTLTVTAVAASGNPSGNSSVQSITAKAPVSAPENDLTGHGRADLAMVGDKAALPAGLWLAAGTNGSNVDAAPRNIGTHGTGANTQGDPTEWNGTEAVVGHFFDGGAGFNDILTYNPNTQSAEILKGNGDGSVLKPASGGHATVARSVFTDDDTGATTTHVANAGWLKHIAMGESIDNGFSPDLLIIFNGQLTVAEGGSVGIYEGPASATVLAANGPLGTAWTEWTITSAVVNNKPGMFARHDTGNGELYYYSPSLMDTLIHNALAGTPATDGSDAPALVKDSGNWSKAVYPAIQAADVNRDDIPDLRGISPSGQVDTYTFTRTGLNTAHLTQKLSTATHAWPLADSTEGTASTAADNTASGQTPLPLTGGDGTSNTATWATNDLFNPDVHLDGAKTGVMNTSTGAVTPTGNFTVSAWAKPDALGGTVLSQDGTNTSGFKLFPDAATKHWSFCMAASDVASPAWDCATSGTAVQMGVWTHLTGTYNATSKRLALYVNGIVANTGAHNPASGFIKSFRVGDSLSGTTRQTFFKGAVSNVQVWDGTALTPTQTALMSGIPGFVVFPGDDSNYPSGSTWTAGRANMSFNGGQLTISNPGYGTWTLGSPGGHAGAVMTFQTDGNLVSYPQAAHTTGTALWSTNTNGQADVMFFQPDGNLVLYKNDGTAVWSSNTYRRAWHNAASANEAGGTGKLRYADFNGDGRADAITIADNGSFSVKLNAGGDGHGGWTDLGQVSIGATADRTKVRFADFNGDGKTDYIVFAASGGAVSVYLNNGGDGHGGWTAYGQVTTGSTTNPDLVRFADFNGDGKTDYIVFAASGGAVTVYLNNGGDGHGGWTAYGQVTTGSTTDRTRVRWTDIDGDGKADYTLIQADGSIDTYINLGGDGHGGWAPVRSRISAGHTTTQAQADFTDIDGDGRGDYLLINGTTNAWLTNGGDDFATPGWIDDGQILGAV